MNAKYTKLKDSLESEKLIFDYSSPFNFSSISSFKTCNFKSAFSYTGSLDSYNYDSCAIPEAESWSSQCLRIIISCLCYVLFVMSLPISLIICIKRVPSLERIVIIRLGKLQPVKGPGMVIVFPCIDIWSRVDLKPQKLFLEPKNILTADGGIIEITTEIEYQVADIVHFVTKVQQLEKAFHQLCHQCLVNTASEKTQDFEKEKKCFESSLQEELNRTVISWGLEVTKVEILSVKVLKEAEPVDALGNLISSLRTAFGFAFEENVMPGFMELKSANSYSLSDAIISLANKAIQKGLFKNVTASYKFIVDNDVLYCVIENESVKILGKNEDIQSNVIISLSNKDLEDLLSQKISPTDAYQQGKVEVSGDWKLLNRIFF